MKHTIGWTIGVMTFIVAWLMFIVLNLSNIEARSNEITQLDSLYEAMGSMQVSLKKATEELNSLCRAISLSKGATVDEASAYCNVTHEQDSL